MCFKCGVPSWKPCNCSSLPTNCCDTSGCPVKLDFTCIIYHKNGNLTSNLIALNLPNGSTLQLIIDTIDEKLRQLDVPNWLLPCLRADYTIADLQAFGQAVDTELCLIKERLDDIETTLATGLTRTDSNSIDLSGTLPFEIQADIKVDPAVGNRLTVSGTGVLVAPQDLVPDYVNKTLAISGGNTIVNMASFFGSTPGYLGRFATNPVSPTAGQSWYNNTTNKFRFQIDGSTVIDLN